MPGREKRGRLSAIEFLPPEARPYVEKAIAALNDRGRTQEHIREELNTHLLSLGCRPISRSGFNRYALYLAAHGQKILQAREMASVFAEKLEDVPGQDIGLLLSETIKTLLYEVVQDADISTDMASIKMLQSAARAVKELEHGRYANLKSAKIKTETFLEDAADAAQQAARQAGISDETARAISEKILGIGQEK